MLLWAVLAGGVPGLAPQPALAQAGAAAVLTQQGAPETVDSSEASAVLQRARDAGATIIVIEPGSAALAPAAAEPGAADQAEALAMAVRRNALALAAQSPMFPAQLHAALQQSGGLGSLGIALVLLLVALAVGLGADRLIGRWANPQIAFLFGRRPESRAEKIAFLLTRGVVRILRVAVQAAVAAGIVVAVDPGNPAVRTIALTAIVLFAVAGFGEAVFRNLLAADLPEHRLLPMSQDTAWALYRDLRNVLFFALAVIFIAKSGEALGLPRLGALLMMSTAALLAAIASIWFTLRHRRTVERIILALRPGPPTPLRAALAHLWYLPLLLYFLVAWAVTGVRLLLGSHQPLQLVSLPVAVTFGALAAYGLLLALTDQLFRRQRPVPAAAGAAPVPPASESPAPGADPAPTQAGGMAPVAPVDRSYAGLAERAVGWITLLGAAAVMMSVWGLDSAIFGGFWGAFWEIVLVAFLAGLAYEAVRIAVDRKIAEEGGAAAGAGLEEEGPRRGLSRLGTLLPLTRTFLLLAILVFAGMVILSALGVDVTPLFAGAGVIGLAIGFGAQTLIRDIFSGAFFLIDDAFRIGEYVNVGPVKGTVERISIRSMQLRHQLGPLHTIPFGEIKHLENYSRDWVVMKLPLRLTYDTDVEQVRKLIKGLGEELLQRPDIGHLFLQPLKSQGVFQMEDSAMIIRVKFMTRPGDQFPVRKMVYSRIRELFAENGIRFAHRQVTVRLADDADGPEDPAGQRRAVAAAGAAITAATPQAGEGPGTTGAEMR
ncbi:MAG: mechanosensitive ion channel family protein [Sneathiellaceae bacterium]